MSELHPIIEQLKSREFWSAIQRKLAELRSEPKVVELLNDKPFDETETVARFFCDREFVFSSLEWFEVGCPRILCQVL